LSFKEGKEDTVSWTLLVTGTYLLGNSVSLLQFCF